MPLSKKVHFAFAALVFAFSAGWFVLLAWHIFHNIRFPNTGPQDVDVRIVPELVADAARREGVTTTEAWMTAPHGVHIESSLLPDGRLYVRCRLQRGTWHRDHEFWLDFVTPGEPVVRSDAHTHDSGSSWAMENLRGEMQISADHVPEIGDSPLLLVYEITVRDGGSDNRLNGAIEVYAEDLR